MRMIWQAVRAVTIEAIGIGAVIFVLFSAAGWTVDQGSNQSEQQIERAWQWVQETTDRVATTIKPKLSADQRERFAAERLEYYSSLYREAATGYASQAMPTPQPAEQGTSLPTNQLLGTL